MGIWGAGIFDDDEAADLRTDYRVYLADAQSNEGATDLAARRYDANLADPGRTTAFWLALALIEQREGRLDPRVRTAALSIIDTGLDLAKWTDPALKKKRAKALQGLRHTLTSASPPPKPMPKPIPTQLAGWTSSDVVAYRMENGRYALLHVLYYDLWSNVRARAPVVSVLNWFAEALPNADDVAQLTYLNHAGDVFPGDHLLNLAMPAKKALSTEQFIRPGFRKPVLPEEAATSVHGVGGEDGLTLELALRKRLWPYWEDPKRPVHMPDVPANASDAEAREFLVEQRRLLFGAP